MVRSFLLNPLFPFFADLFTANHALDGVAPLLEELLEDDATGSAAGSGHQDALNGPGVY